jgi:hypothetical protein
MRGESYRCALAFDTDNSEFVRGVEVGRLWEQLQSGEPVVQEIHASNAEMLLRMAEATGRSLRADELDDRWLLAHFDSPPGPPNEDFSLGDPISGEH